MMDAKKDENEDLVDLVDAVYEYLTKNKYPTGGLYSYKKATDKEKSRKI